MPCLGQFTEILCVNLQRFRFENSVQLFFTDILDHKITIENY